MPDNVVLLGFSATGKSSIGRLLAAKQGWPFIDTDELIVQQVGKSIAAIFRDDGEVAFRAAESEAVAAACAGSRRIVSLGGGAPIDPASRERIRDGNWVVRLEASPETILHRLRTNPGAEERPMLIGSDPLGRIRTLLAARAEAFAIADFAVDTDGWTTDDLAVMIHRKLVLRQGGNDGWCV